MTPRTSIQPTLDGGYTWRVLDRDGTVLHEGGWASCSAAAFAAGDRAIEQLKPGLPMTLSPLMRAALLYLLAAERGGSQGVCATRTALALHRRGLVLARFNRGRGYDCDLTGKGRRIAREL